MESKKQSLPPGILQQRKCVKECHGVNLGITAKRGNSSQLLVAVHDLLTTAPISALISTFGLSAAVDRKIHYRADGTAMYETKKKPFLLIAKKGLERGY
jgi:hypothetical protein